MQRRHHRKAAVTVEFAIAAPILFLVVFASIEFGRVNMIRNTMENAAYEGARRGVLPGATAQDCTDAAQFLLDVLGISQATITVTPTTILPTTKEVTVDVQIPVEPNSFIIPSYFIGSTLSKSITLPREAG